MKNILLCCVLLLSSFCTLSAQFDTIVGPFLVSNALFSAEDKIYLAAAGEGAQEVLMVDVNNLEAPPTSLYTTPFGGPMTSLFVEGEDLYLASSGPTTSTGKIIKVTDINSSDPNFELYLDLPWLPTSVVVKDSVMYISRFFFVGGSIFSYDMTDPNAELEIFINTGNNSISDMVLYENQLLITDVTDNRVYSIDLNASNPTRTAIVFGLDTPSGIEVDGDMLYVAVGNYNSNASSRVKVYDLLNLSSTSIPEEELAETTNLPIIDVARVDGRTYVLEYQIDFDDLGYLLRVEESPSAIQSISEVSQITVFPNPTKGNISFGDLVAERVEVVNARGQVVAELSVSLSELDLSSLTSGVYTLIVHLADGTIRTSRVVKQ